MTPPSARLHYVFVEGGIGAGKSTLLARVADRLRALGLRNLVVVPEPLEAWRDCDGHNVLELFYREPARWALAFQTHAMATRVTAVRRAVESHRPDGDSEWVVLCERSVHSDRHVFVEMLTADGTLSGAERALYITAYEYFVGHAYPGHEAGVIYLRATAERCAAHMRERDRSEETALELDYLRRLVARHDAVMATGSGVWPHAERLVLDVAALGDVPRDESAADRSALALFDFITKACGSAVMDDDDDDNE